MLLWHNLSAQFTALRLYIYGCLPPPSRKVPVYLRLVAVCNIPSRISYSSVPHSHFRQSNIAISNKSISTITSLLPADNNPMLHPMSRQQYSYQTGSAPRQNSNHGTSSAFSASANPDEDWTQISDLSERRRIQNRIAQRNYRESSCTALSRSRF